jgi:hypothetical protein
MNSKYFAQEEAKKLIQTLENKISKEKETRSMCGLDAIWSRNRLFYYAALNKGTFDSGLDFNGSNGELIETKSNQMRSLLRNFLALVTKQRLNFEVSARNTDSKTASGVRIANSLVKQIITDQKLDLLADSMAELCLLDGESYLSTTWNPSAGKLVQEGVFTGELEMRVVCAEDVVFEGCDFYKADWVIVRSQHNKFDLIAEHPELEDKIRKAEQVKDSDELVYYYSFYHKPTPSLPQGRITLFTGHDCVFFDAPNPYPFLPLSQMKPEPIHGTRYGYSIANDLVPLQELHDLALSTASSNVAAYGLQTMLNPEGNGLSKVDIGGIAFLNYKPSQLGGGKPEPLALPSTPGEVYRFSDTSKSAMMEISGINAVLRGNPPPNVTSGAFASILSSQAIEASQPFSKSYFLVLEDAVYKAVQCYKLFAKYPLLLSMIDQNKNYFVKEFIGDDLGEVVKLTMRVTSPLLQTSAGLSDVAEKLLKSGLITNTQDYLELISTGNLETFTGDALDSISFLNRENELLSEGKAVRALVSDSHGQHIIKHKSILNDPDLRLRAANQEPEALAIVEQVMAHLSEHYELLKNSDPQFLALLETGKLPQTPQ